MKIKKILKIIGLIFLVIFFVLGCVTIYKFFVIQKIFNKMNEYISLENYYMEIKDSENQVAANIYYKDGVGKMCFSDKLYTWVNGAEAYLIDDENKEVKPLALESSILISNEYVGSMLPGYSKTLFGKFLLAGSVETSVKTEKIDDVKYYIITTVDEQTKKTIWLEYESLLPSQVNVEIGNISETLYYDITFEEVKYEDVKKPVLDEYTIVE